MPLSKYDAQFGGKGGAAKAHRAMVEQYGADKGERVFYATKNKRAGRRPKKRDRRQQLVDQFLAGRAQREKRAKGRGR
jgi:hypothetical protein